MEIEPGIAARSRVSGRDPDRGRREHFRLLEAEARVWAERDAVGSVLEAGRCALGCAADPRPLFERHGTPFVACPECGLVFVGRQLDEAALARHFEESEAWAVWARDVLPDPDQLAFDRARFERALVDAEARLGGPGRAFDVGASAGVFLSVARERGWQVAGVEPSAAARSLARERYGLDLQPGRLEDVAFEDGPGWDLITFWASLEYCKRPADAVASALQRLRPGGLLLVYTSGNAHSLVMRLLRERCVGFVFNRLWYFAPDTLDRLVLRPGVARVARHSLIPSVDVIARGLEYADDPYDGRPPKLLDAGALRALGDALLERDMGYKFQTLYRKR